MAKSHEVFSLAFVTLRYHSASSCLPSITWSLRATSVVDGEGSERQLRQNVKQRAVHALKKGRSRREWGAS